MRLENHQCIDISPLVHSRTAVFPGDTPFKQQFVSHFDDGNHLNISRIETTVHIGAHTDAPSHYAKTGQPIDKRPLDYYLGTAQVVSVENCHGRRIRPEDLNIEISAPRVLFRTGSFPNPDAWNSDFASLSSELIEFLAERSVRLVGIDTPSIDPAEDKTMESHEAIHLHDMAILEGIVLDKAADGIYQLIALPLRIEGADASPVRAVLLR